MILHSWIISNLPFLTKTFREGCSFLNNHFFWIRKWYSGFRAGHSTETALVKVVNDLPMAVDSGMAFVLIILEHSILLERLGCEEGVCGTALKWFYSYLQNRTFSANFANTSSCVVPLKIWSSSGIYSGAYVVFIVCTCWGPSVLARTCLIIYMQMTRSWSPYWSVLMRSNNFLQLNERKPEIIIFGPLNVRERITSTIASLETTVKRVVIIDSSLSFEKQIKIWKSTFHQLWLISRLKPFRTFKDLEIVVHVFITSRLDYCNSLYAGISQRQLSRMQLAQNAVDHHKKKGGGIAHYSSVILSPLAASSV